MPKNDLQSNEDRVNEAIAFYFEATERGAFLDLERFLAEHADIRSELDSFFANQSQVQQKLGVLTASSTHGRLDREDFPIAFSERDHVAQNGNDTELIVLLDAAIDDIRDGATLDIENWAQRHPEFGDRGLELFKTVRDLALAAEDWRQAARTIVGTEMIELNGHTPQRENDNTVVISVCDGDSATDVTSSKKEVVKREKAQIPERFGRYEIVSWIGAGAMGDVYRATDPQLERPVAVKVPKIEGRGEKRQEFTERFLREARTAAAVRHPHICPIYDTGEQDGTPYVVMAYVNGESLSDRMRRKGRYENPREAVALALDIAEALDEVHQHGIIHRDLKPGNILVDASGKALLTDFGLARSFVDDEHLTADGVLVGTPAYMSPEQALDGGKSVGPASDLYGLGIVLYEMLTGKLPFTGGAISIVVHKAKQSAIISPLSFRPDLDPTLVAIVERAVQHEPDKRFADAGAFAAALKDWLESDSSPTSRMIVSPLISPAPKPVQASGIKPRGFIFVAAACLIIATLAWFAVVNPGAKRDERGLRVSDNSLIVTPNEGSRVDFPDLPPLSGQLKIRFIANPDSGSAKVVVRQPKEGDPTPLFNGQNVQLQTKLSRPGFIYVIWVDSDGAAEPIYPWDFETSTALWKAPIQKRSNKPADFIPCPEKAQTGFRATGKPGMQHVVVLARSTPLKSANELQSVFSDLPASPLADGPEAAKYVEWSPVSGNRIGFVRGLEAGATYYVDDVEELDPSTDFEASDMPMFEIVKSRLKQQHLDFEFIKVWRFAQKGKS